MADGNKSMEMDQNQSQAQQQSQGQQNQSMIITTQEMQQNMQQQQSQQQQQNQAQQQNQQQANGPQKIQTQVQVQPQVATIMPQQHDAVSVSMHQQQQSQQSVGGVSMTLSGQQGATTITTMAAHPQAVQVIQQPMQNQYHLQQLYNAQGTPLLMPGNLLAHPAGINPSPIQVQFNNIAGKPFQAGAQLAAPHMLTTASTGQGGGHPGSAGAKVQGFPAGYIPVPTSATPGAGQTLVFGQLEVLPQHQTSIQQQQQQQAGNKTDQVQKAYTTCAASAASGQNRQMQFAPWQFATATGGIWTGLQPQLLAAAPNQIFIRDPQTDMFIQSPQPLQAHNALAAQQQIQGVQQIATTGGKPRVMNIQQQQQQTNKQGVVGQRPLSILPSSLQGVQAANIRPASSVSTQTNHGVQSTVHAQSGQKGGGAGKGRGKPVVRTSPGPNAMVSVTKAGSGTNASTTTSQPKIVMQQQGATTATTTANGKMLIATSTASVQPAPGSPMTDKQAFNQQANKQNVMQSSQQAQAQQVQAQQVQAQQQAQLAAAQQQHIQQIFIQRFQQQQHLQQQYRQTTQGPQQIQPKPLMGMAVQQPGGQQQNVVLGGERPIMPVVSINPALIGNQIVGGAHQIQALPIVSQSPEQIALAQQQMQQAAAAAAQLQQQVPTEQPGASMPMLVTSPERAAGAPVELQTMMPPPAATPMSVDEAKASTTAPSKKDSEETNGEVNEAERNAKEDDATKTDDKTSTNPLINLANAVNSITNGNIGEETTVLESLPTTVNKQVPPKAMVKPQVLTHVIEGFVIQEASEPFAVNRSSLNGSITQENNIGRNSADKENHEEPPSKRKKSNAGNHNVDSEAGPGKCENCNTVLDETSMKLKKDKRFCTNYCAKAKKKELKEMAEKQWTEIDVDKNDTDALKKNGDDKPLSNLSNVAADSNLPKINPVKWSVNEVCDFIRNLPGCADYAEDFAIQEIDGQALMLLKEDHLMSAMSIKLGPALKIVAKIDSMRDDSGPSTSPVAGAQV